MGGLLVLTNNKVNIVEIELLIWTKTITFVASLSQIQSRAFKGKYIII